MGAWGYGPFDNDVAGDMVAGLMRNVQEVIDHQRADYAEARVSIQFILLAHGKDILGGPRLDVVVQALAQMRADTRWLSFAKSPRKLANEIEKELAVVMARIQGCRGCRRAYNKQQRAALQGIIDMACAVPMPVPRKRKPDRNEGLRKQKKRRLARKKEKRA